MKHYRVLAIMICCLYLVSCVLNPTIAVPLPAHPLYVIHGQNAVPGQQSAITLVDRDTWTALGTRTFPASFIYQATYDQDAIWFGLAGDVDNDAFTAVRVQPGLEAHRKIATCMEPSYVHRYQQTLLVVCPERGFVGKIQRIDAASGILLNETEVATQWGDMYVHFSYLIGDEVYVEGSSFNKEDTEYTTVVVFDAGTLQQKRIIHADGILGTHDLIVGEDGTIYMLNFSSHYLQDEGQPFADVYTFDPSTYTYSPLPLIQRSPLYGAILDGYLYTIHFSDLSIAGNRPNHVEIHKTNLTTWQNTHWKYPANGWSRIGDMAAIDGRILITKYSDSNAGNEGIYALDTTTGELSMVMQLPGATLLLEPHMGTFGNPQN
jgi:hypothetical protein